MIIPNIRQSIEDFETNDLISVLFSATKIGIKKREIKRNLLEITLQSMGLVKQAIKSLETSKEIGNQKENENVLKQLSENYFELFKLSKEFVFKEGMKK